MKHLLTGAAGGPSFSKQVACSECHNAAIPATPLHANGLPNVAFGTLARTGAVTPSYAGSTCSNTYCHGNFQNGAGANAITWNAGAITCNSCHGTPPGGTHPAGSTLATCGNCHGNYSNATSSIIDPAGHVNGVGRPLQHVLHLLPRHRRPRSASPERTSARRSRLRSSPRRRASRACTSPT